MLFKQIHLQGIKSGKVSLAIRKWKKPGAKKGSSVKTFIGLVKIEDVVEISEKQLTPALARAAGYETLSELKEILDGVKEGVLFKIKLRYEGADPRIKLRAQKDLTESEVESIRNKLARLDKFSKDGSWTMDTLRIIKKHPLLRAVDLAKKLGKEKDPLKINIRKLKNIGLTISHETGYSISPMGEAY